MNTVVSIYSVTQYSVPLGLGKFIFLFENPLIENPFHTRLLLLNNDSEITDAFWQVVIGRDRKRERESV